MERMAGKLADRFYSEKAFPAMSYEAFKYVLEFSLEMAAGICASAVIAVALGMEWETAAFLMVFWVLRSYAGGLHLDKFGHCFVFSAAVIACSMMLVKYSHYPPWLPHVMFIAGGAAFIFTEPESDRNREVDEDEDVYFRKRLRQSLLIIAAAYLFCFFIVSDRCAFIIALAVDVVYALMILGKIKNGKI